MLILMIFVIVIFFVNITDILVYFNDVIGSIFIDIVDECFCCCDDNFLQLGLVVINDNIWSFYCNLCDYYVDFWICVFWWWLIM